MVWYQLCVLIPAGAARRYALASHVVCENNPCHAEEFRYATLLARTRPPHRASEQATYSFPVIARGHPAVLSHIIYLS